jgi:hypothetical protein
MNDSFKDIAVNPVSCAASAVAAAYPQVFVLSLFEIIFIFLRYCSINKHLSCHLLLLESPFNGGYDDICICEYIDTLSRFSLRLTLILVLLLSSIVRGLIIVLSLC